MPEAGLRIAITGSAGTGKTTLACALARHLGLPLVPEEMRAFREGRAPHASAPQPPLRELGPAAAAAALADLWGSRAAAESGAQASGFVADNCSADFAAYALHHGCAAVRPALVQAALDSMRGYDAIFLLPHGAIPYQRDGVRASDPAEEWTFQLVLQGLLAQHGRPRQLHRVPSELTDSAARVRFCLDALAPLRRRAPRGFVSLVGAGPGDPELLTLRAARLLDEAEVVAHDALISPAILARIRPQALRLLVGRRHGDGKVDYRLHPLALEQALAGKHVVRLKQGDPFIFGRGGEEAEELLERGIDFEIVPGISAALGAAAYAGIPLTHREHASSVTLSTGHAAGAAHGASETLVLFMGHKNLDHNVSALLAAGRSPATPAALIASATTPEQRVLTTTLSELPARAAALSLGRAPALLVIGEVVRLRERLAWFERRFDGHTSVGHPEGTP